MANAPAPADPARVASARRLLRQSDRASLATVLPRGGEAWPYASLVLLAVDHDLSPILLLSDLAEHSRAIAADPRVSLLLDGTQGHAQPLTGPRLTVLGRAARTADPAAARRFLARHPDAALYAGFRDFAFYRVTLDSAHLVAGFGAIHWLDAALLPPGPAVAALAAAEPAIVAHMNEDHAEALDLYACRLLGLEGTGWRMTGIDCDGLDLRREGSVARLDFPRPATDAGAARQILVELARQVRGMGGGGA